jgi:hypothetical protein
MEIGQSATGPGEEAADGAHGHEDAAVLRGVADDLLVGEGSTGDILSR